MKINLDLLPEKFKSLPRAWNGIYILLVMILICTGMYYGLKYYYDNDIANMEALGEERVKAKERELAALKSQASQLENRLNQVTLPKTEILNLNKQIEFFNKIYGRSFSWYEYFEQLEKRAPKNVWIKQVKLTPSEDIEKQEFELNCEGTDPYLAPMFLKNLMLNKEFVQAKGYKDVFLSQVLKTPEGGHEFSLKYRFLPIKTHWVVKPGKTETKLEHLSVPPGATIRLGLRGQNIAAETLYFGPGNYLVEVTDEKVGLWSQYDETFTGRAPGMCELIFMNLDRKKVYGLPVEVKL